ncbi:hypothetical protein [Kocuria rosea]|uniref:hypothetical protein n=1 Tax=Kocuria rosea TaxID=1275 RepID=UPI0020424B06|nr:hypothetical protein [Kocuria rosea]MCM3689115.1 hypothetical protein [Kocuria rosea]
MGTPWGADDEATVHEQARCLRVTMVAAGIDRAQLWLYYFGIGGDVSELELDAYLHHALTLPRLQRDLLAQAANEILADLAPPKAPYAADLLQGHPDPVHDGAADDRAPAQDGEGRNDTDPGTPGK